MNTNFKKNKFEKNHFTKRIKNLRLLLPIPVSFFLGKKELMFLIGEHCNSYFRFLFTFLTDDPSLKKTDNAYDA